MIKIIKNYYKCFVIKKYIQQNHPLQFLIPHRDPLRFQEQYFLGHEILDKVPPHTGDNHDEFYLLYCSL